jgi:hypothetical protein
MSSTYLPPLNVDPRFITISGYSSGSAMANNVHVAHSATIKGGNYNNGGVHGSKNCMDSIWAEMGYKSENEALGMLKDQERAAKEIPIFKEKLVKCVVAEDRKRSDEGKIDNVSNIKSQPVYVTGGD